MTSPHPDMRYITALLEHDRQGISDIYARFAGNVERLVKMRGGTSEDARDVFQDSLMAISRQASRPDFVLTCPFEAYLWYVCRGRWLNELRRRQRTEVTSRQYEVLMEDSTAEDLAERTWKEETRDEVFRRCFAELPENCRRLLQTAWSGLSMEEVSQKLGITYGYARKQKCECLKNLMNRVRNAPEYADIT